MKLSYYEVRNFWLILSVFWLWTCSGGGDKATGPEEPPIVVNLTSLTGQAQKGPFNNGTSINVAELSNTLSPTGRNFSSAITDNTGRFAVANVQLESPFVELRANGFYFNEVSNNISDAQLTLYALSDLTNKSSLNVNILTHLEKNRMQVLMSGDNPKTFAQAKLQAQEEVLAIFDYSRANMPASELLDISQGGAANAKLLAISAILQGDQTVGQMSELLANISTDLSADGTLDDSNLQSQLITNTQGLDVAKIRSNLSARFTALGITATIPDFATEINQFLKPPVAQDMSASTGEDTPINITLAASDPEDESLTYTILEVNNATVTLNGNVATYTPDAHFNGTDTFTFYANDGTSDSNIATVTMTVSAEDDEPNTLDVATTTDEDVAVTVNLSAEEYDGDSYSFAIITDVSNGTTSLNGSTVTYTPNQDFNGEDTFTFEATDDTGRTINVATATITVNPINDAPIANNITNQVTDENRMMQLDITLDATDVDGDALTYSISSASNGTLSLNNDIVTYVPNQDWNGEDTFTYVANDGSLDSNTATVTITVNSVNDAPTVNDITLTGDEDTSEIVDLSTQTSDIDGDALTYSIITDVTNGTTSIDGSKVTYTPDTNWSGTDSYTYKANDGSLDSNTATVTITVNPVNDAPIVEDIRVTLNENRLITTNLDEKESSDIKFTINSNRSGSIDITLTADDPEGDTLVFSIVETNAGAVSLEDNVATYTPSQDWNGVDTFSFKAFDGELESNVAKVILSVNPQNDAPTVKDMTITTSEDTDIEFILDGTDIDGDNLHYSIVTDVVIGDNNIVLENDTGPNVIFQPGNNWYGTEQFTYMANDGSLDSNVAQVTLVVSSINDAPTANDVTATVSETRTARSYFRLDGNDVDGDVLEYIITENVSNGTVSLNGAEVNYVPSQDFVGQDTLKYKVNDGVLDSNIAAAYITITAVNDPPVTEDIYVSTDEDNSVRFTFSATDVDSAESFTYVISSLPDNGTVTQSGKSITYEPNSNWNGQDVLKYYAVDEDSERSNISSAYIQVNPMEDAPFFDGDSLDWYYTLEYGIKDTVTFSLDSIDPDGDNITWATVESETPFSFNDNQSEIYILGENMSPGGSYTVNVYGTDDKGNEGAAGTIDVDIFGGPTGIQDVIEVDHNWEDSTAGNNATGNFEGDDSLRDPSVSYVPWASLGRTGYIIEHRAGGTVNQAPYARDFDRFNYWTEPSQFDIELDFSQESIAWDYINETVNGYVPFSAYLIDNFTNEKTQLFAGYWENDGSDGWSLTNENSAYHWQGPTYSADAWEPIYLFWHLGTPYDPANESQYISDNDLATSGGCGWASSNCVPMQSSNADLPAITPTYPIMTATLFTDYLDSGLLPTADGHVAHGSGWDTASSIIFDTEYEFYDTPQGNNDDSSRNNNVIQYDDNALPQFGPLNHKIKRSTTKTNEFNYEPER